MKDPTLSTSHKFLRFFHGQAFGNFIFLNILGYTLFKDSVQLIADVCQTIIVLATLMAFYVDRAFFIKNRVFQLLCLAMVVQCLSWISSRFYVPDYALKYPSMKSMAYLFFFLGLAYWLRGEPKRIVIVLLTFCAGVIFTFAYHSSLFSIVETGLDGARVDFNYRNAQHGSLIAGVCFLFFVLLLLTSRFKKLSLGNAGILLGILLFGVFSVILQSRQSWLAISASLAILPLLGGGEHWPRRKVVMTYAILLLTMLALYQVPFIRERLLSGFVHQGDVNAILTGNWNQVRDFSIGVRLKTWLEAIQWFLAHPFFGTGYGSQSLVITLSKTLPDYITREFRHLHNSNMETLVCWGIAGFLVLYGTLFSVARQVLSCPVSSRFIKMLAISFILYWLIINNFESFFYMRSGQWVFSVFMGAIYSVALHGEMNRFAKEGHENLRH
ncbi:O-antigen ligase family protein [Aeromonas sanarellii]|uniref:O-antigen ligase family protein n=1 Tax=Aeromonas sanarellii TaxID=633415 RepID=A0ABS4BAY0_9GAMM|nr:O-antigen ligase family protein [Aeromonas sanarellii]MBP0604660.1 O-antigen ligase family protein [Aeromonas sanarellii]